MRELGRLVLGLGNAGLASLVLSCGTDAKNIETCREIEQARCSAALQCGLIDDAAACELYFRDHCLHGSARTEAPKAVQVQHCVAAIGAAGRCAEREGKKTPPGECGSNLIADSEARNVCEIVEEPERTPDCAFLEPPPEEEDEDDGDDDNAPPVDAGTSDAG